jgi:hypothetical protein
MKEWAAIDIADALELLSPDFKNQEVRAHAVATLQVRPQQPPCYHGIPRPLGCMADARHTLGASPLLMRFR